MATGVTKKAFFKGLAALLPTVVTVYIFVKAYQFVSSTIGEKLTDWMSEAWAWSRSVPYDEMKDRLPSVIGTVLALTLVFLLAVFLGFVLASFIGRKIWSVVEKRFFGFPVIRLVYPPIKQMTDFVFGEQDARFRRVGMIEYPRKGVYSLGFITGGAFKSTEAREGREMVTMFIPSSPTPFTGYCVQVAQKEVIELDIPVDSVIRYTVSGGVILPPSEGVDWEGTRMVPDAGGQGRSELTGEDGDTEEREGP